jgi:UDP-N-acetylglucosamine--N-acetylmuramyl-(pentapeptide) pyrophosphoryl-undecaprenol N-acetylglucosamine transferase
MSQVKKVFIAGGGTGGHIYPALAIARAIQKQSPGVQIEFVGTTQGLEGKIIPREGYALHLIEGGKLNFKGQFFLKLKTFLKLPYGLIQSFALIVQKKPDYVLGVGGYASGPFVLAAAVLGRKTAIWEPNAHPGLANMWLSKVVKRCFLVFDETAKYFPAQKILKIGMPVREEIELGRHEKRNQQRQNQKKFTLLHYGGSQGARALGKALCEAVLKGGDWLSDMHIIHQSGSLDYEYFKKKYAGLEHLVDLREFIYDMPQVYNRTDLVMARAGASTITELAAYGLPSILIPLPLADGHQVQNAKSLAQADAAIMIPQSELNADKLIEWFSKLKSDAGLREKLSRNIASRFVPRAAEKIAKEILSEITKV